MKTTFTVTLLTLFASLSVVAQKQDNQPGIDHQKHMQVMTLLKDSSSTDMLLSNIAADHRLRIRMAEKIAEYTEKDTTAKHEVCAALMKGMTMNEGGSGCGMMKHETMQGKTGEAKKEEHVKSHKH